jgi:hypothetical protein
MDDGLLNRPAFMLIVIAATALLVKAVIDYLSRRQLIAKGATPEDLEFGGSKGMRWHLIKNLKWALICLGFGAAIIVSDRFPNLVSTTGSFGLMFVGAGLGYLVYFLVAWHWSTKEKQRNE